MEADNGLPFRRDNLLSRLILILSIRYSAALLRLPGRFATRGRLKNKSPAKRQGFVDDAVNPPSDLFFQNLAQGCQLAAADGKGFGYVQNLRAPNGVALVFFFIQADKAV